MARLAKRDVEALLDLIDTEPVGILTRILQKALDLPDAGWDELVAALPYPPARRAALAAKEPDALYDLAAELNERREVR